jgi:hypothetical protein
LLAQLALLAMLPQGYSGPNVSLTAVSNTEECIKSPAVRMGGPEKATIVNPGPGQCGEDGNVEAGTFELTEVSGVRLWLAPALLAVHDVQPHIALTKERQPQ